jgi:hypothetical protein
MDGVGDALAGGGGTLPVAGETPMGVPVAPADPGTWAAAPIVAPGRVRQDGGSDGCPRHTAPGCSQKPVRGLQTVPATHWA